MDFGPTLTLRLTAYCSGRTCYWCIKAKSVHTWWDAVIAAHPWFRVVDGSLPCLTGGPSD